MTGIEELERGVRVIGTSRGMEAERWAAFERLTQERLERTYRLASLLLDDPSEAQDAVHDAVLQAWAQWSHLREPARFDAWFERMVVHRCIDRLRRRRIRQIAPAPVSGRLAPDPAARAGERDALREVLGSLSPAHRVVVVLRFAEDLSIAEIAARTGEREGTVKSRLHYALRELRAAYGAAERAAGDLR